MIPALGCLLLLSLGAPAERLKLAVEPLTGPLGAGADEATSCLLNRLANVRTLTVVAAEDGLITGCRWAIRGTLARHATGYRVAAYCVDVQTGELWPGSGVSKSGGDLPLLCRDVADCLAARLTGGCSTGAEAEDQQVRNDNSNVTVTVGFAGDAVATQPGLLPFYLAESRMKLHLSATQPGHYLVIAVGADQVSQLYPPVPGAVKQIAAEAPLTIPNSEYAPYKIATDGFKMTGQEPGVERIHVFFARQPIARSVPSRRVAAEALSPRAYYDHWLPELRSHLRGLDPLWNGTSASYFYAVTPQGIAAVPAGESYAAPPAAQDRGAVIPISEVVGVADLRQGDAALAHDLALLDARRNALEAALGVMLTSTTRVAQFELLEDRIDIRSTTGFVRIVRELGEPRVRDGALFVTIAAEVSVLPLVLRTQSDHELRSLYDDMERPRVLCLVSEEADNSTQSSGGAAETQLVSHLRQAGFDVIQAAQAQALNDREKVIQALSDNATAAQWLEANAGLQSELVVVGTACGKVAAQRPTGVRVQTDLALSIIHAADGRVLWAETPSYCPLVAGGDAVLCCRDGLKKAVDALIRPATGLGFLDRLAAEWAVQPTVFTVLVSGATRAQIDDFEKRLRPPPLGDPERAADMLAPRVRRAAVPAISSVSVDRYSPELSTLTVRSALRPHRVRRLLEEFLAALGWSIKDSVGTRLSVSATRVR